MLHSPPRHPIVSRQQRTHDASVCALAGILPAWASRIAQQRGLHTAAVLHDRAALLRMIAEDLAAMAQHQAAHCIAAAGSRLPSVPQVTPTSSLLDQAVARLLTAERQRRQADPTLSDRLLALQESMA